MKFNKQLLTLSLMTACAASVASVRAMEESFDTQLHATLSQITSTETVSNVCCRNYLFTNKKLEEATNNKQEQLAEVMEASLKFINDIPKEYAQPALEDVKQYAERVEGLLINHHFGIQNKQQRNNFFYNTLKDWKTDVQVALTMIETSVIEETIIINQFDIVNQNDIPENIIQQDLLQNEDEAINEQNNIDNIFSPEEQADFLNMFEEEIEKDEPTKAWGDYLPAMPAISMPSLPSLSSINPFGKKSDEATQDKQENTVVDALEGTITTPQELNEETPKATTIALPENEQYLQDDAVYAQFLNGFFDGDDTVETTVQRIKDYNKLNSTWFTRANVRTEWLNAVQNINKRCDIVKQAYNNVKLENNNQDLTQRAADYKEAASAFRELMDAIIMILMPVEKHFTSNGVEADNNVSQIMLANVTLIPCYAISEAIELVATTCKQVKEKIAHEEDSVAELAKTDLQKANAVKAFHEQLGTINQAIKAKLTALHTYAHNEEHTAFMVPDLKDIFQGAYEEITADEFVVVEVIDGDDQSDTDK